MKRTVITITVIVLLIALFFFTSVYGLNVGSLSIPKISEGISLGLDLVGGSEIVYEAQIPDGMSDSEVSEGMETALTMLRQRLNNLGFTEANVYLSGSDRIVVEIPNVDDPEQAVQMLGTTALIQFVDCEGNVILEGDDVSGADAMYGKLTENDLSSQYYVALHLSAEASEAFKEATSRIASYPEGKNYVAIMMDGEIISTPYVSAEYAGTGIDTDSPIITLGNSSDVEYAQYLEGIIDSGHMP
ncbi:MAG: preprotein translocase subunit SecD, partial [Oscillospiraceae bacterium]